MQPTEPAAIARLPVRPRLFYEGRVVSMAFVVVASLGIAWMASWFAYYGRVNYLDGTMPLAGALFLSLALLMLGVMLERVGAHGASVLVARAVALAPLWAATLFFATGHRVSAGSLAVVVVIVALMGAVITLRTPLRSWAALAGLALLWVIPLPSVPVDVDDAPLVQLIVNKRSL